MFLGTATVCGLGFRHSPTIHEPGNQGSLENGWAGHVAFFFQIYSTTFGQGDRGSRDDPDDFPPEYFAEIFTTTTGGPGTQTTNLAFLVYRKALLDFDIGGASAGGIISIVFANIVAIFLLRMIAKNMNSD